MRVTAIVTVYDASPLLPHFIRHYGSLGLSRLIVSARNLSSYRQASKVSASLPVIVRYVPSPGFTDVDKSRVEEHLLRTHGSDAEYFMRLDLDEFHEYPAPLPLVLREMSRRGILAIRGWLIDRVVPDGSFPPVQPEVPIDVQFPVEVAITSNLLEACSQKIMLARRDVKYRDYTSHEVDEVDVGRVPVGFGRDYRISHYKWTEGTLTRLRDRLDSDVEWGRYADETRRLFDHLRPNGRLNLSLNFLHAGSAQDGSGWTNASSGSTGRLNYRERDHLSGCRTPVAQEPVRCELQPDSLVVGCPDDFTVGPELSQLHVGSLANLRTVRSLMSREGTIAFPYGRAPTDTNQAECLLFRAGFENFETLKHRSGDLWLHAVPRASADGLRTSIIVLAHNELMHTRRCVESVMQRTDEEFELILVDNASTDATLDYFLKLAESDPRIRCFHSPQNLGFAGGCNLGIREAHGDAVVLLNNDTIVTSGWLARLLRAYLSQPHVGLVGPCSNEVGGKQQIDYPPALQSGDDIDRYGWLLGQSRDQSTLATHRLVGFCLLIGRPVIESIGLLDERFGVGLYEDDDYCLRSTLAGFRNLIALDAFVFHVGGATFRGAGFDRDRLLSENARVFSEKWGGEAGAG